MSNRICSLVARTSRLALALVAGAGVTGLSPAVEGAQESSPAVERPAEDPGPWYAVGGFTLVYDRPGHPQLPPPEEVAAAIEVELELTDDGFVAPRPGRDTSTFRLADAAEQPARRYAASALQRILETVVRYYGDRELLGVYVAPDAAHIDRDGRDMRPGGQTQLRLVVTMAFVTDLRTIASGSRIEPEQRIDHPAHRRIRDRSPFRPTAVDDETRSDLLRRDLLDEYVFFLSRHPGRRVDAAIGPGATRGGVVLDYLVTESRPLVLYAQLANTGTEETNPLRARFGLIHNQLTNNDDVLGLDYITSGFEEVHALQGSYEAPFPTTDRLRWRVFGGWSRYTASDVGIGNDIFTGESAGAGAELSYNFHQHRSLFADLVFGLRVDDVSVDNQIVNVQGQETIALTSLGIRLQEQTAWYSFDASLRAEWTAGAITDPAPAPLGSLGRLFPDTDWFLMRWDVNGSVYLEPLINRRAWRDRSTPRSSTLAHELGLRFRGQYSFENRLIPQYEQVIGGLATVRGYPESVVAGDSVLIANVEYRFHLPRTFGVEPTPAELFGEPFRVAPQMVYGRPDWDLVFKGFIDYGQSFVADGLPFEAEETLVGAGIGIEFQFKRSLNARLDWGVALTDSAARGVDAGSNRVHFLLSVFF